MCKRQLKAFMHGEDLGNEKRIQFGTPYDNEGSEGIRLYMCLGERSRLGDGIGRPNQR